MSKSRLINWPRAPPPRTTGHHSGHIMSAIRLGFIAGLVFPPTYPHLARPPSPPLTFNYFVQSVNAPHNSVCVRHCFAATHKQQSRASLWISRRARRINIKLISKQHFRHLDARWLHFIAIITRVNHRWRRTAPADKSNNEYANKYFITPRPAVFINNRQLRINEARVNKRCDATITNLIISRWTSFNITSSNVVITDDADVAEDERDERE